MSHHSDEQAILSVTSDSFWEPGNYKRTTKRIDDGHRLCTELQALIQERADIEKTYAKSLRGWSKKWNDLIEKGPEYGTMEAAWKGSLVEADRLCELHIRVRDNLVNDTITQIKNWQKDTYHKTMINQLKERKEMDEAFKKAQKPWAKILQKVERTRQDYHMACKQERTAQNQERNAGGDSSLSPDQVKKMADRVSKCREEVGKNREKYQAALAEITAYNPRYIQDMTAVFERCQQMEAQRLTFFKDVLFNFHKCLNISQDPTLPQIYEEFHHTVNNADHQKDLKWWANNHGVNMNMGWPQFEREPSSYKEKASISGALRAGALVSASVLRRMVDWLRPKSGVSARVAPSSASFIRETMEYTEEFRDIAKGKSKEGLPTAPITLLHQRTVVDELPPITANNKPSTKISNHTSESNSTTTGNGSTGGATIDKKTISAPIAVTIERLEIFTNVQPPGGKWKQVAGSPWQMTEAGSAGRVLRLALKPPQRDHFTITEMTDQILPLDDLHNGVSNASKTSPSKGSTGGENPFEEEEWEEEEGLADSGEPGEPVRALYDYTGAESDELTFRQGDLFEKLEDEDEQGWCKGRKDGRVGLYPANYVEPVGH